MKQKIIQTIQRKGFCDISLDDWDDAQQLLDEKRIELHEVLNDKWYRFVGTSKLLIVPKLTVDEDMILDAFRYMRKGGHVNLGVKSPWWAKFVLSEFPDQDTLAISLWRPSAIEIAFYELLICVAIGQLSKHDRDMLITRCGTGKRLSLRKCGLVHGMSHVFFQQQFQAVIRRLKNVVYKL